MQRVLKFLLEGLSVLPYLTWAFFEPSVMGGGGGAHDVPPSQICCYCADDHEICRGIKLDVFYTLMSKKVVMSLLLCNYDIITCILANNKSLNFRCS